MNSVVCDTGPVNYLIQIDCIHVLEILFRPVFLPGACHRELLDEMAPAGVREWASEIPHWISVIESEEFSPSLAKGLSPADSAVITIAAETNRVLLMDALAGRRHAQSTGIKIVGTIGILELAGRTRLVSLREALSRLQQTNIRISDELYLKVLERNPELL